MTAPAGFTSMPHNVPFLNILDPAFDFTSPEALAAQERSWYAEGPTGLLVLRYAEAQELLRDRRLNHNGPRYMELSGISEGPVYDWYLPMIVNQEGEEHRRLRGLVNKAFTPRMVNNLRPFIERTTEDLTARLTGAECEFVEDFAARLPLAVMCRMLGIPPEDYASFHTWTKDLSLIFNMRAEDEIARRVEDAVVGLGDYADTLLARKRREPGDDLISALVAACAADDGRVSDAELRNLVITLVFAAHDTTRHQLSNAMVAFAGHPGQWTLLGRHPELAERAMEEVMRWMPSTVTLFRFAAEDLTFHDLRIPKDTFVMICGGLAQRDPRAFPGGDRFDITARRDTPPLLFGGGPHHCLGAALARVELAEALPVLARRLGPPSVVGPVTWRGPVGIHGPETLPLVFGRSPG